MRCLTIKREQMSSLGNALGIMIFASFIEHYTEYIHIWLMVNTWNTQYHIIWTRIVPWFEKLKMIVIMSQLIGNRQN